MIIITLTLALTLALHSIYIIYFVLTYKESSLAMGLLAMGLKESKVDIDCEK